MVTIIMIMIVIIIIVVAGRKGLFCSFLPSSDQFKKEYWEKVFGM